MMLFTLIALHYKFNNLAISRKNSGIKGMVLKPSFKFLKNKKINYLLFHLILYSQSYFDSKKKKWQDFLLWVLYRSSSKMKKAQWGFSFKNLIYIFWSSIVYILITWSERYKKKLIYLSKRRNSFCIFSKLKKKGQKIYFIL